MSSKYLTMPCQFLPLFVKGKVIKGFGRGSRQLGCPTANYEQSIVDELPKGIPTGVYFGWASVDGGPVYKMVMNLGWCPYYNNEKMSLETHIIQKFENDFYGSQLKICILGYLRPEKNFPSLERLIEAIQNDIKTSEQALERKEFIHFKCHDFFEEQ